MLMAAIYVQSSSRVERETQKGLPLYFLRLN